MQELQPAQRLCVAADFEPPHPDSCEREEYETLGPAHWTRKRVISLANQLKGSGVVIKVNSALRALGYDLLYEFDRRSVEAWADLKLNDTPKTLEADAIFLADYPHSILTVMASAGATGIEMLKKGLPNTEILAVTALTSMTVDEVREIYRTRSIEGAVMKLAKIADDGGADGIVCAPTEIGLVRSVLSRPMRIVSPNVRFAGLVVKDDDQNQSRVGTPAGAIAAGADRIVMGRPVSASSDPLASANRALGEIHEGLLSRSVPVPT